MVQNVFTSSHIHVYTLLICCSKAGTLLLVSDNVLDHLPAYALFKEVLHAQRGKFSLPGANAHNRSMQALADVLYN